jgi:hypothetical protein
MAITTHTFNVVNLPMEGNEFFVSQTSQDASGYEAVLVGAAGKSHYVTEIYMICDAAIDISIGSGADDPSAIATVHFGLIPGSTASVPFHWKAPAGKGVKFTSESAIVILGSAAGTIWIETRGKTCRDKIKG